MYSKEERGASKFANFVKGEIVHRVGNEKIHDTHIEGRIVYIEVADSEYQRKPYRKVSLTLRGKDGQEVILGFPMVSGYGLAFIAMCPNIKTELPVKISGGIESRDGKDYSKMFVQQAGKFVKWFYTKDSEKKMPVAKVKADGTRDFTKLNEFMEKLLVGFEAKIVKSNESHPPAKAAKAAAPASAPADDDDPIDDDMPF